MFRVEKFLAFRGVPRRRAPVTIDADPSDWDRKRLAPLHFFRLFSRAGAAWGGFNFDRGKVRWQGEHDNSGRFCTQWDEQYLYFLFELTDDQYCPGGKGVGIWSHDALHFLLYPFEVQRGQSIKGTNYKEHIGLDQDGQPTYDRCQGTVGNWTIGSGQPDGVKIAVKPSAAGVVMEFAVPFAQFAPFRPTPGAKFAISCMYYDRDGEEAGEGVAWYYAVTNVDTNPAMFGNFQLIE